MSAVETRPAEPTPHLKSLDMDMPWAWLAAGWRDLWACPSVGLTYGFVFAAVGALLAWVVLDQQVYYLTFPLMAGFLLVGPVVAAGLYEISRRRAAGEPTSLRFALGAFGRNPVQIGFFGVVLLLINIAWVRLAALMFMLHFSDAPPPVDPMGFLSAVLTIESIPFIVIGCIVGAVLAAIVFGISVIAIPLLIDRPDANVVSAIHTSWTAAWNNKGPMALWAWLIVLFIGVGLATGFIGLIVTLPLIGHASWAAYKTCVDWSDSE